MGWWGGCFIHLPRHSTGGLFDIVAAAFGAPGSVEGLVRRPSHKNAPGERGPFLKTGRGQDLPRCPLQDAPAVPRPPRAPPGSLRDQIGSGEYSPGCVPGSRGKRLRGGAHTKYLKAIVRRPHFQVSGYNTLAMIACGTVAKIASSTLAHAIHTL